MLVHRKSLVFLATPGEKYLIFMPKCVNKINELLFYLPKIIKILKHADERRKKLHWPRLIWPTRYSTPGSREWCFRQTPNLSSARATLTSDIHSWPPKLIALYPCPADHSCHLLSKFFHSISKYCVHNFGNRQKKLRSDGQTDKRIAWKYYAFVCQSGLA